MSPPGRPKGEHRSAQHESSPVSLNDAERSNHPMLTDTADGEFRPAPLPLQIAADLQDNLLTATNDLDRLQTLLADACEALMRGFHGAIAELDKLPLRGSAPPPIADPAYLGDPTPLAGVMKSLGVAITALQFQDMASQLIAHTHQRLRNCADRLANETMGDDEEGSAVVEAAPMRPNPVTQDEMDAGSVELF